MKKYKVIKDTFKHEMVGSIATIISNIDMPQVKDVKTGYSFYCPMDNLKDVTMKLYAKRFDIGVAIFLMALLLAMFASSIVRGFELDFWLWIIAVIGWGSVIVFLINEEV